MFEKLWTDAKAKANELANIPVPLGKTVVICGGLIILTWIVSGKPKTIVINRYSTGGLL